MKAGRKLGRISIILAAGLVLFAGSCVRDEDPDPRTQLVQGWSAADRSAWYQGTQGSRLMPAAWARALERADGEALFFTDANLAGYRFLPLPGSQAGLPIGFALDDTDARTLGYTNLTWYEGQPADEPWIGLNCSACHTARIAYGDQQMTIDGGPSLVDFQGFVDGVGAALAATRADPAKWERFAARVLAGRDTPANRAMLRREFDSLAAWEAENARLNRTPLRYGYGRLDAFGHIFNKVAQLAVYRTSPPVRPTPNPADAPVSYPFLWDIYRHDRLQWNGIAETSRLPLGGGRYLDYGALGRNTGEVIGVFGDVVIAPDSAPHGFRSSVEARNLDRLETMLRRLQPPPWPDAFPALVPARVEAGQALYARMCQGCHRIEPAGTAIYAVRMIPLTRDSHGTPNRNNTDPWMACNAISYTSATGGLRGTRDGYLGGEPLDRNAPLATMLKTTVVGTLVGDWRQIVSTVAQIFLGVDRLPRVVGAADAVPDAAEVRAGRLDACYRADSPLFAYKARPLDGIWATAPYLHNGSVPTLYDLLLPPSQRPARFNVGTREYDPARVGYRTDAAAPGNDFDFVASGNGNSNEGHDYNVGRLSEEQRLALLEYLKSL